MAAPAWSPRGRLHSGGGEYEHVTVDACPDPIASCNACGRPNYERTEALEPNGLKLVTLAVNPNGYQRSLTSLCPPCAREVATKLIASLDVER